jgi:hypothetical protein
VTEPTRIAWFAAGDRPVNGSGNTCRVLTPDEATARDPEIPAYPAHLADDLTPEENDQ